MATAQDFPGPDRTKLDNYVKELLTLMYKKAGRNYRAGVQVGDPDEVRWFVKEKVAELVHWIKEPNNDITAAEDGVRAMQVNPQNASNVNKLTATAFCQHLYHVRGIEHKHINQALQKLALHVQQNMEASSAQLQKERTRWQKTTECRQQKVSELTALMQRSHEQHLRKVAGLNEQHRVVTDQKQEPENLKAASKKSTTTDSTSPELSGKLEYAQRALNEAEQQLAVVTQQLDVVKEQLEVVKQQLVAYEEKGLQGRMNSPTDKTINKSHFEGAENGCCLGEEEDENGSKLTRLKQEIVCVGAFAIVQFENGKNVMHFAHNESQYFCLHPKTETNRKTHAEVALLRDLSNLLIKTKDMKRSLCIFLSFQPCHLSTNYGNTYAPAGAGNVSCCDEVAKFLDDFKKYNANLEVTIRIAYLHKVHWSVVDYQSDTPEEKKKKQELSTQINTAWEGFKKLLIREDLKVCEMTKEDWKFLKKNALQ